MHSTGWRRECLTAHGTPSSVAGLEGYRAILLQHDAPRYWPLLCEHLPCQRVMTCNNITFAREATLAGAGICGLPVMISEGAVRSGRLVELLPEARLPVGEV